MSFLHKILLSFAFTALSFTASATMITNNSGFDSGDSLVTFDEVGLVSGQSVTTEFASFGVTFDPHLVAEDFRTTSGFSGQSLANFFPVANPFTIDFVSDVDAFGAYWEFNTGTVTTFNAFLDGALVDSFNFTETNCCQSGTFLGFTDVTFDSVQVSINASGLMIMDNLQYSTASVPEPAGLALLAFGLIGLGFGKRKSS